MSNTEWVVLSCWCGSGSGDHTDYFDTMTEAREWVDFLDRAGDGSVIAVVAPDGRTLHAERDGHWPSFANVDSIQWPAVAPLGVTDG